MHKKNKAVPLLEVKDLVHEYLLPRKSPFDAYPKICSVDHVSFSLFPGECFGIVGESGCGKSTLARIILAIEKPKSGKVFIKGQNIHQLNRKNLKRIRQEIQMIFQDPYGSLDPRQKVHQIVAEPLSLIKNKSHNIKNEIIFQTLENVGLSAQDANKYPHEFSGGQRQRIAIARALVTQPALIVADEPVSALDVSIQAQILNLMMDLRDQKGLAYIFISHDLSVVQNVTSKVAVMYAGQIVELGNTDDIFYNPLHPYTQALLAAVPNPDFNEERGKYKRSLASFTNQEISSNSGCKYVARCLLATAKCHKLKPKLMRMDENASDIDFQEDHNLPHKVACHLINN